MNDAKKIPPIPKNKKLPLEAMPNCSNVVSATECTGLMPTLPENEEELESYRELSSMEIPELVWGERPAPANELAADGKKLDRAKKGG